MGTLAFERGASTLGQQMAFQNELQEIIDIAKANGTAKDPVMRQRLADAWIGLRLQRYNALRMLSKAETALLLAERDMMAGLGIEISEFGRDSISVSALPAVLGERSPEGMIHDLLALLGGEARSTPLEERRLEAAKLIACKAAVKAGDRLTESEMQSLLEKAGTLTERNTCPHGRPTMIHLSVDMLERQFGRQGAR